SSGRYIGVEPLFEQAGGRAVRFQMGRIDHQPIRLASVACETCEDTVEDAHPAPADKAVVERLVRAVLDGRVAPAQAIADDVDNAADDPLVVHSRNAVRQRKKGEIRST